MLEFATRNVADSAGVQSKDRLAGRGAGTSPTNRSPFAGDSRKARGRGSRHVAYVVAAHDAPVAPNIALRYQQVLKESTYVGRAGQIPDVATTITQVEWEAGAAIRVFQIPRGGAPLLIPQATTELRGLRIAERIVQVAADRETARARRRGHNLSMCPGTCREEDCHEFESCLHLCCLTGQRSCRRA